MVVSDLGVMHIIAIVRRLLSVVEILGAGRLGQHTFVRNPNGEDWCQLF